MYFDGHQQATSNVTLNVLYKMAGRAFLLGGGASNNVTQNLIVNSGIGIYNANNDMDPTPTYVQDMLDKYDNGTLKRGDTGDFVWRTLQAVGGPKSMWQDMFTSTLALRFPTFSEMMKHNSSKLGWASCESNNFSANIFLNNSNRFGFLTRFENGSLVELFDEQAVHPPASHMSCKPCIIEADYTDAEFSDFPKHEQLEFKAFGGAIDTTKAGLRCDEFRRSMPSKAEYRAWAREYFDGISSYNPICRSRPTKAEQQRCWHSKANTYSAAAATKIASMESGAKLLGIHRACPPLTKSDCISELLPWGQCQANGKQVFRFTIQAEATLGGVPCEHEDGEPIVLPC